MRYVTSLIAALFAGSALADSPVEVSTDDLDRMRAADVVILGEIHDNPAHHTRQAEIVAALQPKAIVAEMLTAEAADELARDPDGYGATWAASGWLDYASYLPIFTASDAVIKGAAVPRAAAKATYSDGVAAHFAGDSAAFGLDQALPQDEHAARIELQFLSHCEAMPREALGGMIEVQRLRDAELARVALEAVATYGPPAVVITGNGHARKDWGVASYLARVQSDLTVITVGQSEDGGRPEGGFDLVYDAPPFERPDPCAAFR